ASRAVALRRRGRRNRTQRPARFHRHHPSRPGTRAPLLAPACCLHVAARIGCTRPRSPAHSRAGHALSLNRGIFPPAPCPLCPLFPVSLFPCSLVPCFLIPVP